MTKLPDAMTVKCRDELTQEALDIVRYRGAWARVQIAPAASGGWDVVLRLDGAYRDEEDARRMAEFMATVLGLSFLPPEHWNPKKINKTGGK